MSFDQAPKIKTSHRPNWEMPEMMDVKIRTADYRPRAPRNFTTPLPAVENAVEIIVTFKAPPPARAMAPVLYIGDTRLTESEPVDKAGRQLRFWAFERARLRQGAPIEVRWMGEPPAAESTGKAEPKFTYSQPK